MLLKLRKVKFNLNSNFRCSQTYIGDVDLTKMMNAMESSGSRAKTTKVWTIIVPRPAEIVDMIEESTIKNMEPVMIRVRYIST